MGLLSVRGITKREKSGFAVDDVSFNLSKGSKIAIAGETGSGKTTLLKMIAGLSQPDTGEIFFEEKKVDGPNNKLIPGHPRIAYLSQHFELRNNYSVEEELESKNQLSQKEAGIIYSVCRIDHLLKRKTDQLSGGERQRIVLARLLTTSPGLLLLDEPFSNLDPVHKSIIRSVIADINLRLQIACILVSHEAADTLSWADSILIMKNGKIIQQGTPEDVYHQPANEYCAGIFGEYNLLSNENTKLFSKQINKIEEGKKLFARPEYFTISKKETTGIAGKIMDVQFRGNHYLIKLICGEQLLLISSPEKIVNAGEEVGLALKNNKANWYL